MSPRKLNDEFSSLKDAWERAAKRREAKKLCAQCGCPNPRPEVGIYCPTHVEANRAKASRWYANTKGKADVKS